MYTEKSTLDESTKAEDSSKPVPKPKLWTRNFVLLWQGQFVSDLGDNLYSIALSFWVLAKTNSTALMGAIMAVFMLPMIVLSPFAGVLVDRISRKRILILMDILRGGLMVLLSIRAFSGFIDIWMLFIAAFILGTCAAFFTPAVNAVLPEIVEKDDLIRANSAFGFVRSGSDMIGSSLSGFVYKILGAPFIFLANGISFLISGATIFAMKSKKAEKVQAKTNVISDFKEGIKFLWGFRGLKYFVIISAIINFFSSMAIVLLLPLFERTEGLGPEKYGISMALFTFGMLVGMMGTYSLKITANKKFAVFMSTLIISCVCFTLFSVMKVFPVMCVLLFLEGICMSVSGVFLNASVQLIVDKDMLGKVFGIMSSLLQGFTPIAMVIGGILAEFIPLRNIIFTISILIFAVSILFFFIPSFRKFINYDPKTQTPQQIM